MKGKLQVPHEHCEKEKKSDAYSMDITVSIFPAHRRDIPSPRFKIKYTHSQIILLGLPDTDSLITACRALTPS